jgi:hypothetical protein
LHCEVREARLAQLSPDFLRRKGGQQGVAEVLLQDLRRFPGVFTTRSSAACAGRPARSPQSMPG